MISNWYTLLRLKQRRASESRRLHSQMIERAKIIAQFKQSSSGKLKHQLSARREELDYEIAATSAQLERTKLDIEKFRKVIVR